MIRAPCRIRHVDLAAGVPGLDAEPGLGGTMIVFWWGGLPLGAHTLVAGELPIPAAGVAQLALRAIVPTIGEGILARGFRAWLPVHGAQMPADGPPDAREVLGCSAPLAEFVRRRNAPTPTPGGMTLIICTRDRPADLARCLESIVACEPRFDQVVVVDNAPADPATREVVARWPGIEYVAEPRPGLSIARNAGIRAATGEIVAFTDDDVVVHRDWPARLARAFADERIVAVTGLVLPAALDTDPEAAFEEDLGGFGQGFRPKLFDAAFFARMRSRGVPAWRLGSGANMAFRRSAFDAVGPFDVRLGAGASGCSEDSEMWYRLLAAGHVCRYEPTAVVFHRHRGGWDALLRQVHAYLRGHVVALFVQYWRHGHLGNLRRAFGTLPWDYVRLCFIGLRGGLGRRKRLLPTEIAGWFAGICAALRLRLAGRQKPGAAS